MIPKFRAWDKIRNRISEVERIYIDTKGVRLRDENGEYWRRSDDVILMQSTGLVDKNGKEIFEGDVVEFEDADDIENVYTNRGVVEWCQGGFTVTNRATVSMDDLLDGDKLELEIIGNIYENLELVEVNNDQ
ncbi:TPA: YopX family protein [Streptococcus suis]